VRKRARPAMTVASSTALAAAFPRSLGPGIARMLTDEADARAGGAPTPGLGQFADLDRDGIIYQVTRLKTGGYQVAELQRPAVKVPA
jgi:hypothetical protein